MLKKIAFVLLTFTAIASADIKIAVINMEKVFDTYYKTEEADARFKGIREENKKQFDRMVTQFQEKQKEGRQLTEDSSSPLFTEDVRKEKRQAAENILSELRMLDAQIKEFQKSARENLIKQSDQSRKDILNEMMTVINSIVKDRGYDLVLDNSGKTMNRIATIVYSKAEFEITDEIIKTLNAGHEKKSDK